MIRRRGRSRKGDRLAGLGQVRSQRMRIAEAEARRVAADNKARFEEDLKRRFHWLENRVWEKAFKTAEPLMGPLIKQFDEESARLGIPEPFRPKLSADWSTGGIQLAENLKR